MQSIQDSPTNLRVRKRFFSLDHENFPDIDSLENDSTNAKTNSGVKSQFSDEPCIIEHLPETFEDYMLKKDQVLTQAKRVSSRNLLVDAPVNLVKWKIYYPSFFKM